MSEPGPDRVVVVGPASWNTLVAVPALPDARPQTVFATDSWSTLGGTSAGKALQLADLGIPVTLSTVLGTDDEADLIRGALVDDLIELVVDQVDGRSERHLNLMAGGDRVSVYLSLPGTPRGPLPSAAVTALARARHVVLDLSERSRDAIPLARAGQATVWTDLHDDDGESTYRAAFREAADRVFLSADALGDPRPFMARLRDAGKELVVCTLGADGALALDAHGWHSSAAAALAPEQVVDTNGAGDAFLAGYLAATIAGAGVDDALRRAGHQATRALSSRHLAPR